MNLRPNQIGIEITENILLESTEQVIKAFTVLHNSRVHISIDDFGTGYSSLYYLKQLPLSGIKIDQSFVHEAPSNKDDLISEPLPADEFAEQFLRRAKISHG